MGHRSKWRTVRHSPVRGIAGVSPAFDGLSLPNLYLGLSTRKAEKRCTCKLLKTGVYSEKVCSNCLLGRVLPAGASINAPAVTLDAPAPILRRKRIKCLCVMRPILDERGLPSGRSAWLTNPLCEYQHN